MYQPIPDKPISEWAEEQIRMIELAIRAGHFSRVRQQLDQLESLGLHHDPIKSLQLTLDDYLITLLEQKVADAFERKGILTFRQFLQTPDCLLETTPNISKEGVQKAKQIIKQKFGRRRS